MIAVESQKQPLHPANPKTTPGKTDPMNTYTRNKPEKPYPTFPLTAHPVGQWSKKIRQKVHYFGSWADPEAAMAKYVFQRDDLQAGRKPKPYPPATTPEPQETTPDAETAVDSGPAIHDLVNRFLSVKKQAVETGELAQRSFEMYERSGKAFSAYFGRGRQLANLDSEDFEKYRNHLSKGRSLVSLTNELRAVRIMFNFGWAHLIEPEHKVAATPMKLKSWLKMPSKKAIRIEQSKKPARILEADELRNVIAAAGVPLKAMILLGLNCGFGNNDIASLPETAVDLKSGWVDFPRPKTGIPRRCPLWPETVTAVQAALAKRPKAKDEAAKGKLFVTKYGAIFVRSVNEGTQVDSIALEFGKLLRKLVLKRKGLNFYCLRSVLETIGGDGGDQACVDALMGHVAKADDMAAIYRKRLNDSRRLAVVELVRLWLWPGGSEQAWLEAEAERLKNQQKQPAATKAKRKSAK